MAYLLRKRNLCLSNPEPDPGKKNLLLKKSMFPEHQDPGRTLNQVNKDNAPDTAVASTERKSSAYCTIILNNCPQCQMHLETLKYTLHSLQSEKSSQRRVPGTLFVVVGA